MTDAGASPVGRSVRRRLFWDGRLRAPEGWSFEAPLEPAELVRDGLPLVTDTVDAAYIGPAIGRLPSWELVNLLEEFRRVIRADGHVRVAAYDLGAALDAYSDGRTDFFWNRSSAHLAVALSSQLLEAGAARTLLNADLVAEALVQAGFEGATPQSFGVSSLDSRLAAPDRFAEHCCFVEAFNPTPWPLVEPSSAASAVHLGLGDIRARSINVIWCAPPGDALVRYRPRGTSRWEESRASSRPTIDGAKAPQVFEARCGSLRRSKRYEYEVIQVADGKRRTLAAASFETPPSEEEPARLAFIADTGISGRADGLSDGTSRIVEELLRVEPAVVLGGGDYAYRSSDARWRSGQQAVHAWLEQMAPLVRRCPLMVQYGNHEVELGERYRDWAVHFTSPAGNTADSRSYSFDVGPCHVSAFYAPTESVDPAELNWLWQDLSAAKQRRSCWLIVFQHQPLVAHGVSHPADGRVARSLGSVLDHHRVDLHLSAHDQNYERTYPLTWKGAHARAVPAGENGSRRGDGTIFAKVSPGGKRSSRGRDFSKLPARRAEIVAAADDTAHHIAVIDADDTILRLTTYGLPNAVGPLTRMDEIVIVA